MRHQIGTLRDTLGAAHSTLHALQIALPVVLKDDSSSNFCALNQLIDYVFLEITKAQEAVDEMESGQC